MSSSIMFIGAGFSVETAQYSPSSLQVTFTSVPQATNPTSSTDALNPVNYVLVGPGSYSINAINPVNADPLSVAIALDFPLASGTWRVVVSNVKTPGGANLSSPKDASFEVFTVAQTPLEAGAQNSDAAKIIRKHLSPALKGANWDALISAIASGDDTNWTNIQSSFDQLFLTSASGSWLRTRARDLGINEPLNVGMDDSLFRDLAIKTSTRQLTLEAIREILEVFYGQDALRAYAESTSEPYNLSGGLTLTWTLDEKYEFQHTFQNSEFGISSVASATEVAAALTAVMRSQGSKGFAVSSKSPETGETNVRIYSGSLGLGSSVRITGGTAQAVLKFPLEVDVYSGDTSPLNYSWTYSKPDQNTTRATLSIDTGSTSRFIDLSSLREGDYVLIGPSAQVSDIVGEFSIKAVSISWSGAIVTQSFDIEQINFTGSAIQLDNNAYIFFRPVKSTVSTNNTRAVIVAQTSPNQVDIQIPTTTQIVSRGPKTAAYLPTTVDDIGPYIFDPVNSVSITGTSGTTTAALYSGNQYGQIEVTGDGFPDSGYIVLGFGTEKQNGPIQYFSSYKSGPASTVLIIDYRVRLMADYPVGSDVTLLSQKEPYNPTNPLIGAAWLTGSSSARVAAVKDIEEVLAAGIEANITVVYPGDRGLGGEGFPDKGAQKLSDIVAVFAGDDVSSEVAAAREG